MLLGSIPAASTGTIRLEFCPMLIHFDIDAAPTSVIVDVLGDGVITRLDANGIQSVSRQKAIGNLADQYGCLLASGMVNKTTEITIANASVGTALDVYGYSDRKGQFYVRNLSQITLADSGYVFGDFFELALPELTSSDIVTITYRNGHNQRVTLEDIRWNAKYMNYVGDDAYDFRIFNWDQSIKEVSIQPAANQTAYVTKGARVGNLS